MATSTGKTIGLILLVALLLLVFFRMAPFVLAPFGIFPALYRAVRIPGLELSHLGLGFGIRELFVSLVPVSLLILWIAVIIWVYRDAERRGLNGLLWALLVFVGNLIALLIYLIVRSENLPRPLGNAGTDPCPNCGKPVAQKYVFCPQCGSRLQAVCPACETPVSKDWRVCPQCGEKLVKEA